MALTAYALSEEVEDVLAAGCNAYLPKHVDLAFLPGRTCPLSSLVRICLQTVIAVRGIISFRRRVPSLCRVGTARLPFWKGTTNDR